MAIFTPVTTDPLTIAAWLTSRNDGLGGHRPIDALRTGEVHSVLALAKQASETMHC